ncbi:MAG: DegT/DnrJ/EryC1/StrS family aminotransferase [Candidatus Omnitrophica bacterium]|nr:DegT/DnrJ/EryC1/StrS family aminotransferase [Candidatus Omnitrophota bacterium]
MILCSNPRQQYNAYKNEIDAAVKRVLDSGRYILDEETRAFEDEFASAMGAHHAVGVANGTDALILAMKSLGIKAGDEVITVSHTAMATVAAVLNVGAVPVFIDIDPESYTLDVKWLEKVYTPKVKAIIAVHLYGHPADMPAINAFAKAHHLKVIEDCAQAHGASINGQCVGTFGEVGCFSFYPTKNLGAIGDGGAVITNDTALDQKMRQFREYGWDEHRESQFPGLNSRLDEIQAAVLRIKLKYLRDDIKKRRTVAAQYTQALFGFDLVLPREKEQCSHVYHLFVIQSKQRDDLKKHLNNDNIFPGIHYPKAVHQQAVCQRSPLRIPLPNTDLIVGQILSLPMYPELSADDVLKVIESIKVFYQ